MATGQELQRHGIATRLAILLIRAYQVLLSPIFGRRCRYYPTCSAYTLLAIQRFGVLKGVRLGMWRILRCNPFSRGGVDDVPSISKT